MDMEGNSFGVFLSGISLNSFNIDEEEEEIRIIAERTNTEDKVTEVYIKN
jgi:hypothetical protein